MAWFGCAVVAFLACLASVQAQFDRHPRDAKPRSTPQPLKNDLAYIGCGVCEAAVEELYAECARKKSELPKHVKRLEEIAIVDLLSSVCKPESKEGGWIRKIDIAERKDSKGHKYLDLVKPGGSSKCGPECATISYSCYQLLEEEIDSDLLSGLLWKGTMPLEEAKAKVCKKWTKRCSKPAKPLSGKSGIRKDYAFEELTEKDLQMEQMMASMKESGMGGMSMYNRDEMESMTMGDSGDEDEDDPYGGMGGMGGGMGKDTGMDGMPDYGSDAAGSSFPNAKNGGYEF